MNVPGWVGQAVLWIVIAIVAVFLFQSIVLPLLDRIT